MPRLPRFLRSDDPLEKVIEEKVCAYGKTLGIANRKYVTPANRSSPDRIFFVCRPGREPLTFFIEFKRKGQEPTEKQQLEHDFYRALGYYVFVVDNVADGKLIMELMA